MPAPGHATGDNFAVKYVEAMEPRTSAKVLLYSDKGIIEVELWARECPVASRQFLENCVRGSYNGVEFGTIVAGEYIETTGGLEKTEVVEVSSRLKYSRRGLLGMNGGEFFISLAELAKWNGKKTLFGKVIGNSIYNVVRIGDSELENGKPIFGTKILKTEVIVKYFEDLVLPEEKQEVVDSDKKIQKKSSKKNNKRKRKLVTINYDDDDSEIAPVKIKSAHEVLDDTSLSKHGLASLEVAKVEDQAGGKNSEQRQSEKNGSGKKGSGKDSKQARLGEHEESGEDQSGLNFKDKYAINASEIMENVNKFDENLKSQNNNSDEEEDHELDFMNHKLTFS